MTTANTMPKSTESVSYATGKRKTSVARVYVQKGKGKIIINNKKLDEYFTRGPHKILIKQPLEATNSTTSYDIKCFVEGGGHSGQAGAVKHGISRILAQVNDEFHAILRNSGFLTRDDRKVERKKPGQPKARKKFQFSKR